MVFNYTYLPLPLLIFLFGIVSYGAKGAQLGSTWTSYEVKMLKNKKYTNTEYTVKVFEIDIELIWQLTLQCVNNCKIISYSQSVPCIGIINLSTRSSQ